MHTPRERFWRSARLISARYLSPSPSTGPFKARLVVTMGFGIVLVSNAVGDELATGPPRCGNLLGFFRASNVRRRKLARRAGSRNFRLDSTILRTGGLTSTVKTPMMGNRIRSERG